MSFNITVSGGPDATDPRVIDWPVRQERAVVPFNVDVDGLPINPVEPSLPAGRGGLWHWGEAVAADAIVFAFDAVGARHLLMVERGDDHGWALPGGMLDSGETPQTAAARELAEETGLVLDAEAFAMLPGRYVPDPRAGRAAWMVTVPGVAVLHTPALPEVDGRDDARRAAWLPAASYAQLAVAVADRGGELFAAHVGLLRDQFAQLTV
ncbi:NUDIX domain-containing protein [Glycomyces tenuis]|uniref:NUDIX domain-containing protein n=1 Tax=Glycomyces tenuis TaxID=58116 RepID=UPI0004177AA1|nr:NUDIX domain-containing protein [Glycomyces tenuis]